MKAKLFLQVVLLLAWHTWLFFVLPSDAVNGRSEYKQCNSTRTYFCGLNLLFSLVLCCSTIWCNGILTHPHTHTHTPHTPHTPTTHTHTHHRPFTENAAAQCIYFFKCCYFIVSSLQIVSGYPVRVIRNILTRSYDIFSCKFINKWVQMSTCICTFVKDVRVRVNMLRI